MTDTIISIVESAEYFYRFSTVSRIREWAGANCAELTELRLHADLLPHTIIIDSSDAVALRLTFGTFNGMIMYNDNTD